MKRKEGPLGPSFFIVKKIRHSREFIELEGVYNSSISFIGKGIPEAVDVYF